MITALTSPQYVNRIRQDWTANGGVYGDGGVYMATPANNPFAQLGPTLDLVFAGTATDPLDVASTTDDTLSLNFTAEAYQIAAQYAVWGTGGLQAVNFADIVTFTRASTATYFNSAGTLTTATTNEARFDYDPATLLARGFLIEEARTNSIRNNTMQGAVAGTPGTVPTNWGITGTANGLTRTISTGTENGITYIDVRYAGTTTAASFCLIRPEAVNQVAAASGQSWTSSLYMRIAAGSTANITAFENWVIGADAGGAITESIQVTPAITGTMTRFTVSRTMNNASTAFVYPYVAFTFGNGAAIDITLRIGLPQLELGAFATSVIPTTTTALTRSADVASVNTLSPWYNAAAGTVYAETQLFNTVAQNRAGFDFNDGSTNNRNIFRAFTTGSADQNTVRSGGSTVATLASATTPTTAVRKSVSAYAANDFAFTADGAVPVTDTLGAVPVGLTTFLLGSAVAGTEHLNGYLRRITYYPRRLANADLQTITA